MKKAIVLVVSALAAVSMAAAVMGQGQGQGQGQGMQGRPSPDHQAVQFRQALMTLLAGEAQPLQLMQRGKMPYSTKLVSKDTANLVTLAGMIPDAFERNTSSATDVKTRALPAVWQDHDAFLMKARHLKMQADALKTAVKGGSEDDIKIAIKNVGEACGQCHTKYRQKQ